MRPILPPQTAWRDVVEVILDDHHHSLNPWERNFCAGLLRKRTTDTLTDGQAMKLREIAAKCRVFF